MQVGDVDGNGVIYDYDGRLILRQAESIVRVVTDSIAYVRPRWGRLVRGYAVIDTYAGKGTWFITDKRMVFIRKPRSKGAKMTFTHPFELTGVVDEELRIRRVRREGGFDYCEVMYDDVRFYKKYRKNGNLLLMVSGEKYQMHLNDDIFKAALPFLKQRGIEAR